MFQFDENSDESRRTQFWKKLLGIFPLYYTLVVSSISAMNQIGLASNDTVAFISLTAMYTWTGILVLSAGITTGARRFRRDFDTWWTQSPQYREVDQEYPLSTNEYGSNVYNPSF